MELPVGYWMMLCIELVAGLYCRLDKLDRPPVTARRERSDCARMKAVS
jgi:hypothetical protein